MIPSTEHRSPQQGVPGPLNSPVPALKGHGIFLCLPNVGVVVHADVALHDNIGGTTKRQARKNPCHVPVSPSQIYLGLTPGQPITRICEVARLVLAAR